MGKTKQPKEPLWIKLKEGDKRLYVLTHPDPAYHERFLIDKIYLKGYKTPHYKIYDKLKRAHGVYQLLRNAKIAVNQFMHDEKQLDVDDQDIRVVVYNLWKNDRPLEALMRILDYVEKEDNDVADSMRDEISNMRDALRRI